MKANNISITSEATPNKLVRMHLVGKGSLAVFEGSGIFETEEATPTKIGVPACYINLYLNEFFEPILID